MLRLARLSLFLRIVIKRPPLLLELILAQDIPKVNKGWVRSLKSDLVWLTSCEDFVGGIGWDVVQWVEFFSQSPGPYLKKNQGVLQTAV